MVLGDVDATLLSNLFQLRRGNSVFQLILLADRLFYKKCQAGVFSKFESTLPLSITTSLSLGSS